MHYNHEMSEILPENRETFQPITHNEKIVGLTAGVFGCLGGLTYALITIPGPGTADLKIQHLKSDISVIRGIQHDQEISPIQHDKTVTNFLNDEVTAKGKQIFEAKSLAASADYKLLLGETGGSSLVATLTAVALTSFFRRRKFKRALERDIAAAENELRSNLALVDEDAVAQLRRGLNSWGSNPDVDL
jgi:hypothetical protein